MNENRALLMLTKVFQNCAASVLGTDLSQYISSCNVVFEKLRSYLQGRYPAEIIFPVLHSLFGLSIGRKSISA